VLTFLVLEERDLFQRERAAGNYKVLPYFLAKTVTEIPGFIINPLILCAITYWMTNLNPGADNFFIFVAAVTVHTFTALSLFVAVGAFAPTPDIALILAPIFVVLFFLFGGFFIVQENIPVYYQWFGYISFFRYTTQILLENEFAGTEFFCDTNSTACGGGNGTYYGDAELQALGVASSSTEMWANFLILFGMILGYRFLAFLCVYFLHRERR
jgi:ABC-type multidrug transport system permease subunit